MQIFLIIRNIVQLEPGSPFLHGNGKAGFLSSPLLPMGSLSSYSEDTTARSNVDSTVLIARHSISFLSYSASEGRSRRISPGSRAT